MRIPILVAIICCCQNIGAAENALGRLFHTPEQRNHLDLLRQQNPAVDSSDHPIFMIDGEVRRSSGRDTHWINGEARNGRLTTDKKIPPGDRIDSRNGEQQRLLGDGQLLVKRATP